VLVLGRDRIGLPPEGRGCRWWIRATTSCRPGAPPIVARAGSLGRRWAASGEACCCTGVRPDCPQIAGRASCGDALVRRKGAGGGGPRAQALENALLPGVRGRRDHRTGSVAARSPVLHLPDKRVGTRADICDQIVTSNRSSRIPTRSRSETGERTGLQEVRKVRPGRLELPRGLRPTRPSTLRVYQFRHRRGEPDYRPARSTP
jgi:hypothetical protein